MRLTDLNGIVMSNKITLGELISLGILMVTLAGGGYTLHSDIVQTRLEVAEVRLELGEKIDAKFNQLDTKFDAKFDQLDTKFDAKFDQLGAKIGKVNHRLADLQERVATLETIVRVQVPGAATGN